MPIATGRPYTVSPRLMLTADFLPSLGAFGPSLGGTLAGLSFPAMMAPPSPLTLSPNGPAFFPSPGGGAFWPDIVGWGLGLLDTWLKGKLSGGAGQQQAGTLAATAWGAIILAAGGRIIGNIIRISRAAWAKIPQWVKAAAAAAGLITVFDDENGNGEARPRRRRRGITAAQLTGFHRINSLLCKVGMTPRRSCPPRRKRCQ